MVGIFVMSRNKAYSTVFISRTSKVMRYLDRLAAFTRGNREYSNTEQGLTQNNTSTIGRNRIQLIRLLSISLVLVIIFSVILALSSSFKDLVSIKPGEKKGLHYHFQINRVLNIFLQSGIHFHALM